MAKSPKLKRGAKAKAKPKARTDRRGAPKGKFRNPPFEPTDEQRIQVLAMVAGGTRQDRIAEYLGISIDTLGRHFRSELDEAGEIVAAKIGSSAIQKALGGDADFIKFFLARKGGWKTTTAVEQSGPDGGPIVYVNEPPRRDLTNFTEDELEQFERLTAKAETAAKSEALNDPADK